MPGSAPSSLKISETTSSDLVHVTWKTPGEPNGEITGFEISHKLLEPGQDWTSEKVRGDAQTCPIGNIVPGKTYIFKIRALNEMGPGPFRNGIIHCQVDINILFSEPLIFRG